MTETTLLPSGTGEVREYLNLARFFILDRTHRSNRLFGSLGLSLDFHSASVMYILREEILDFSYFDPRKELSRWVDQIGLSKYIVLNKIYLYT